MVPPPLSLPPRAALRMGFLGLGPLLFSGFVCLVSDPNVARVGALSFSIYSAALLSFLGGVRCGIEIMRDPDAPNSLRLMFSALPALGGWMLALFVVLAENASGAASAFAGLFAAQYVWDHRSLNTGAPPWYPLLRQVLTGGAMIACLLLPLASALHRI